LLYDGSRPLSRWATDTLAASGARPVALAPELLAELGEKDDGPPELLAVAFDRPANPGNIGTLIRAADAFGAHGLVVTGHAADPYDPRSVRASTGSLFAIPVVRVPSQRDVLGWTDARIVATDEHGDTDVSAVDLTGPTVVVIGNETT